MEEDNSMSEKILGDIEHILYSDAHLREFCIVPIEENKNKSPVLYEEHNLGLESWCVKYVYSYVYKELFKLRRLLKKNRLPNHKAQWLNKLLIGALLLHPDVTTFWNMRRELIVFGEVSLDKELILVKLILSHKNKSNEAFAYRKWILNKLIKNITREQYNQAIALLEEELSLTNMAAARAPNNYHAWNHKIWCIQNIALKNVIIETSEYLSILLDQIEASMKWINKHVSEHSAFHYRQYLFNCILKNTSTSASYELYFHVPDIGVRFYNNDDITYLSNLLGKPEKAIDTENHGELLKYYNYKYYFATLLSDLLYFIEDLINDFPGHEAIWYHRRYVLFHLLKMAYEYHGLIWKPGTNFIPHLSNCNDNIIHCEIENMSEKGKIQETGEKCPKLIKYELNKVELSYLYKIIVDAEVEVLKESNSSKCEIQRELAKRHENWLKFILGLNLNKH